MPTWRRQASQRFPDIEYIDVISSIELGMLLHYRLDEALKEGDYDRAHEVVAFATWLVLNPCPRGADLSSEMIVYVVYDDLTRPMLWKAMTPLEFETLFPVFRGVLEEEVSSGLERDFKQGALVLRNA